MLRQVTVQVSLQRKHFHASMAERVMNTTEGCH